MYAQSYWKWSSGLQPEWHITDSELRQEEVGGVWVLLKRVGPNSLTSMIAALFFWGAALMKAGTTSDLWTSAVDDCLLTLSHLVDV